MKKNEMVALFMYGFFLGLMYMTYKANIDNRTDAFLLEIRTQSKVLQDMILDLAPKKEAE